MARSRLWLAFAGRRNQRPATAQLISPDWKLEERIHGLLNQRRSTKTHAHRWVFVTTALLSMGAITLAGVQDAQKDPDPASADPADATAAKARVDTVNSLPPSATSLSP